jgi:hypothetical protein
VPKGWCDNVRLELRDFVTHRTCRWLDGYGAAVYYPAPREPVALLFEAFHPAAGGIAVVHWNYDPAPRAGLP